MIIKFSKLKYESEGDRQFRLMLDVQNSIHQSIRLLDSKLAEVLGRQERIVSILSNPALYTPQQPNQVVSTGSVSSFYRYLIKFK
jgi:hypothetical protein